MQIVVEIPDEFVHLIIPAGRDPARVIFEAALLQAYRQSRISTHQMMQVLEFQTRYELDGFLKDHQVWIEYTPEQMAADQKFQDEFVANHTRMTI
jgi:hypothetical protein